MTTALNAEPEMATLQMIRAELNTQEFQRWMGTRRLQDADHAMHCLLVECFGDLAPKPFRLIAPRTGSTSFLYGYGLAGADALREASAIYADPLQERILRASTLDSKPMPTVWANGQTSRVRHPHSSRSCASSGIPPFVQNAQPQYAASRMAATGAARSVTPFCGRRCCILRRGRDGT